MMIASRQVEIDNVPGPSTPCGPDQKWQRFHFNYLAVSVPYAELLEVLAKDRTHSRRTFDKRHKHRTSRYRFDPDRAGSGAEVEDPAGLYAPRQYLECDLAYLSLGRLRMRRN